MSIYVGSCCKRMRKKEHSSSCAHGTPDEFKAQYSLIEEQEVLCCRMQVEHINYWGLQV